MTECPACTHEIRDGTEHADDCVYINIDAGGIEARLDSWARDAIGGDRL